MNDQTLNPQPLPTGADVARAMFGQPVVMWIDNGFIATDAKRFMSDDPHWQPVYGEGDPLALVFLLNNLWMISWARALIALENRDKS